MLNKRFDVFAMDSLFLTRGQVSRTLGVPARRVSRLVATGELTAYRCAPILGRGGRRVFFARAQVEELKSKWIAGGSMTRLSQNTQAAVILSERSLQSEASLARSSLDYANQRSSEPEMLRSAKNARSE